MNVQIARQVRLAAWMLAAMLGGSAAFGQGTSPTPGPTNPIPPNPQSQGSSTIVINPTEAECQAGWNPSSRWTEDQFRQFCATLRSSK